MTPAPSRYAGLAAVTVLWSTVGGASLLTGFPLLGRRPLSWLAADRAGAVLFGTGLAVGALALVVFHGYLRGRYPVGRGFSFAMLAGLAGQVVAAVVPIDGGPAANSLHTAAALTLGLSLPLLMWRFAVAQPPGPWRRVAYRLWLGEAAAAAIGVLLSRLSVAPLAEILPAVLFHLWIVVLTLHRVGPPVPPRPVEETAEDAKAPSGRPGRSADRPGRAWDHVELVKSARGPGGPAAVDPG